MRTHNFSNQRKEMKESRLILEAITLLQHHKVKKEGVPFFYKLIDIALALVVYTLVVWGVVQIVLWLVR